MQRITRAFALGMTALALGIGGTEATAAAKASARPSNVRSSSIYQDYFFGPRFAKSGDVETGVGKFDSVGWKTGVTLGMRFGYWFNPYIGAALGVFGYDSSAKSQKVDFSGSGVTIKDLSINENSAKVESKALAFDILGSYPMGKIFVPYVGIAPTIYLNHVVLLTSGVDGSGTNFGFSIPIGMKYMLLNKDRMSFGLLSEVRFTYNPVSAGVSGGDVKTKIFSTHLLFGLTLLYDL